MNMPDAIMVAEAHLANRSGDDADIARVLVKRLKEACVMVHLAGQEMLNLRAQVLALGIQAEMARELLDERATLRGSLATVSAERDELRATLATHLGAVLGDVAAERRKQIRKWGADHDDEHYDGELAAAGALLASSAPDVVDTPDWAESLRAKHCMDRRRQLVIAAALIVAEIERKDREAERAADKARVTP